MAFSQRKQIWYVGVINMTVLTMCMQWSYGVTCWEVFTCGRNPYPAMDPPTILRYLGAGSRLEKPKNEACSDEM